MSINLCIEGQAKPEALERIAKDVLAPVAKQGAAFSVFRSKNHTLLVQRDGVGKGEVFESLAARVAEELEVRTWLFSGSSDALSVQAFDASGERAWKGKQGKAFRHFMEDAAFKHEPFTVFVEPQQGQWKRAGQVEVKKASAKQEPVSSMELARLLGASVSGVKAAKSVIDVNGVEVTQVVIPHGALKVPKQLDLREAELWFPSFSNQSKSMTVPLPDGTSERGLVKSFRGLPQDLNGKTATIRWTATTFANALVVWVATGPFVADFEALDSAEREAHAEEEAMAAIKRDDPKRLLAAIDAGADAEVYAKAAASLKATKCVAAARSRAPHR